jgi:hypothetical protein
MNSLDFNAITCGKQNGICHASSAQSIEERWRISALDEQAVAQPKRTAAVICANHDRSAAVFFRPIHVSS